MVKITVVCDVIIGIRGFLNAERVIVFGIRFGLPKWI